MRIRQHRVVDGRLDPAPDPHADLVLGFGNRLAVQARDPYALLRAAWPTAHLAGCTGGGQIRDVRVTDGDPVVTAIRFDDARVQLEEAPVGPGHDCFGAGRALGEALLAEEEPVAVMVFADGLRSNGSELVRGLREALPRATILGGLAGDDDRFGCTLTLADDGWREGRVVAVGLRGARLRAGAGSLCGWDPFGPERVVTAAHGNVLRALDGEPALAFYRRYLGEFADQLPASANRFPLAVTAPDGHRYVRSVVGIDAESLAMTFAGDLPLGSRVRLMKANFERIVEGAEGAAEGALEAVGGRPELALLVSCVGRRLALGARTEDELDAVRAVLGSGVVLTGFYSYGELAPFAPGASCELHNQTMTVMALAEA